MRKSFYLYEISDRSLEKVTLQYKKLQKKGEKHGRKIFSI